MENIINNLKEALIGESIAKRKYELFAEQAVKENLLEIAHLFIATAFAESIHIKNHLKALSSIIESPINLNDIVKINEDEIYKQVKDTSSNLLNAIDGENYEFKIMYKNFEKSAKKNKENVAELSFKLAKMAEEIHSKLFTKFFKILTQKKLFKKYEIYVCKICGNIEIGKIPSKCPLCDHSSIFYEKIEMN